MLKELRILGSIVFCTALIAGCSQEARDDYSAAGSKVSQATNDTGNAIKTDAQKTGDSVKAETEAAGRAMTESADKTKQALSNDQISAQVKDGLLAANDLSTTDLKVDTNNKTVTLSGSVPTVEQKERAETIAKGIVGTDYKVVNELMVSPG